MSEYTSIISAPMSTWSLQRLNFLTPKRLTPARVRGDAVIGVDGAFSAVRQSMQKKLEKFEYDESYLAHGYKELTDSARSGWFLANGKERPPYLAAQKFHDDCAAESRWLVHMHTLLGI
jgi:2-polyprenyl-6-methoxyphenol hydroxylase-like FAD-dependent oxidoreductase